ncbi:hypothetical protein SZ29_28840 [Burkholderia pseudomallei]|nr:hypothetical protein SZ29_28840 [Burkholderia pseudomallei]
MRDAWRLARKAASVVMAARAADTCMACGNTHRAHAHVATRMPRTSMLPACGHGRARRGSQDASACAAAERGARRAARLTDRDCAHLDMRDERYAQRARMTP